MAVSNSAWLIAPFVWLSSPVGASVPCGACDAEGSMDHAKTVTSIPEIANRFFPFMVSPVLQSAAQSPAHVAPNTLMGASDEAGNCEEREYAWIGGITTALQDSFGTALQRLRFEVGA
jgi:hypothetical protein